MSVTPGWIRKSLDKAQAPEGVPAGAAAECWKADYASGGAGLAEVWVCGYRDEGSSFDALQRTATVANEVKFQEGLRLAVVKWNGVGREEIKALVRAVQRGLK